MSPQSGRSLGGRPATGKVVAVSVTSVALTGGQLVVPCSGGGEPAIRLPSCLGSWGEGASPRLTDASFFLARRE